MRPLLSTAVVTALAFIGAQSSHASSYTFTTISAPEAHAATYVTGINDTGQVVGFYAIDPETTYSFLLADGLFTTFDVPAARPGATTAAGINDARQIVGSFGDTNGFHGFLETNGSFTTIDVIVPGPRTVGTTVVSDINDAGDFVGYNRDSHGQNWQGFQYADDSYTTIVAPEATQDTVPLGINNFREVVGYYVDGIGWHGFVDRNDDFTTIDVPEASAGGTYAWSINDLGQVAGWYIDDNGAHGFVDTNGSITTIDVPGAYMTEIYGINNAGQIVGNYQDDNGNYGFVATPTALVAAPEPASMAVLGTGLISMGVVSRRREPAQHGPVTS